MGQFLNRILRITKSNFVNHTAYSNELIDEDKELIKIIDELENNSSNHKFNNKDNDKSDLKTAYVILKINEFASIEEIKSAYKQRIREYHPDRLQNFGDEIKELAIIKTKRINLAYSLIKKERNF